MFYVPKLPNRPPASVLLMAFITTGFVTLILSVFGAALLNLFGAGYATRGSLIAFVFLALVLNLPFAPLSTALERRYQRSKRPSDKLWFFLMDTGLSTLIMMLVALFDPTVRIPFFAALLTSLIFSLLELLLNDLQPKVRH
ncbi:YrvL family regulatory protein [Enterococcus asini]|uniref:YrvL family regulatory protein n=1 Tax=Enterococcus asini TaxID=57732 RepID=UPI001E5005CF|nr:YrvL family regulatory protein [Enterococcus asini]